MVRTKKSKPKKQQIKTREDAIKKANDLGYTIRYHEDGDESRFRKAGGAMNSLNQPYMYCVVYKKGKSWRCEEKVAMIIM